MNADRLAKLQSQVRIGGPGTARRKKKVIHRTATTDDKKLQGSLKKLSVNNIPGIEEVNMFKDDGTIIHFNNPKVQASLAANTFAVSGHAEHKPIAEMLPSILNQLPSGSLHHLKERIVGGLGSLGGVGGAAGEEDDEVPALVENFDEASKTEGPTAATVEELITTATVSDIPVASAAETTLETGTNPEAGTAPMPPVSGTQSVENGQTEASKPEEKKE